MGDMGIYNFCKYIFHNCPLTLTIVFFGVRRFPLLRLIPSSTTAVMEHVAVATVAGGAGPSSLPSSPPLSASSSPSLVYENGVESFESGTGPNGNAGKRPAWNMPSNGAVKVGTVMGADSWLELEFVRASAKSPSEPAPHS